ncbi:MAG: dTDP-4-dehydrorhamnose 3,5-epimerase family protein [Actinomycetota bacterium]
MSAPTDLGIEGVLRISLDALTDDRGTFVELFRRSWIPGGAAPRQANLSRSRAGVLRGLHFHRRQWDYWSAVSGTAFVALLDLRIGSPTELVVATSTLSAEEPAGLFIPAGVAHGFCATSDYGFIYLVDAYYDPSDELGVAWDDPGLGIAWPATDPILSDRDRANSSLADIRDDLPRYHPSVG